MVLKIRKSNNLIYIYIYTIGRGLPLPYPSPWGPLTGSQILSESAADLFNGHQTLLKLVFSDGERR